MPAATAVPKTIYLKDYQPPHFWIDSVYLKFELEAEETVVTATTSFRRNGNHNEPLILDGGNKLLLLDIALNNQTLSTADYSIEEGRLTLLADEDAFALTIQTKTNPKENLSLQGLYVSSGNFFTQCEAQGFRHITYFLDRPDVMATYRVEIVADKTLYPVLLSNGNCQSVNELADGKHVAIWEDPFPKPSYLFALVAGDLGCLEDTFSTASGRKVALKIYARSPDIDKCHHAMTSLKKSMAWDEQRFGLEYDLDIYNIVAVSDFNMGAMENKSLNIFNTKYVLASPETATDTDFDAIESVIGHEYFHNWTGNRVTCRDWFQLSLKEGLTVFRDQEFSSDLGSRGIKRIDDVRILRAYQFPEDDGPMAHPIRPDQYIEINNFYTMTVYNKGAEVIRMMHTILGETRFMAGMKLYFERHDGQAVTCDDFVAAMEDASTVDLSQFRRWYQMAGTPTVRVRDHYNSETLRYEIEVSQSLPKIKGQKNKALHIPLLVSLYNDDGAPLDIPSSAKYGEERNQYLLPVKESTQTFVFDHVAQKPVLSLLNKFSAPIKIDYPYDNRLNAFLLKHDTDYFSKWEASQRLAVDTILGGVESFKSGNNTVNCDDVVNCFKALVANQDDIHDRAFLAELLTIPSEVYLGQQMNHLDVDALHDTRESVLEVLAKELYESWWQIYERCKSAAAYRLDADDKANRKLKNIALSYLMKAQSSEAYSLCYDQFMKADNMTDKMAAFVTSISSESPMREKMISDFYTDFEHDDLVIDKWFSAQAVSQRKGMLDDLDSLQQHVAYSLKNPNRMRALVASFSMANQYYFHHRTGRGYAFLADTVIKLDAFNPQIAARMLGPLSRWKNVDGERQELMKAQLKRIKDVKSLSKDVFEIVSKSLT